MKNTLFLILITSFQSLFSQSKIYYYNSNWTDLSSQPTENKRKIIKVNENTYKHLDYVKDTLFVSGEVYNLESEQDIIEYLMFCKSEFGLYSQKEFDKKKFLKAIGRYTYYKDGKKDTEVMSKNNKTLFVQIWDKDGKECLINGSGQQCADDRLHKKYLITSMFKDSVLIKNYVVRLEKEDTLYFKTDTPALPKNGIKGFYSDLTQALKYPFVSRFLNQQGKVFISFVVNERGELVDFEILNKSGDEYVLLEKKTIQNLKKLPNWEPGQINNKPVKVQLGIPIKYELTY